ncbi:dephospho-CoA kinase [Paraburkholderia sp. GAS38]
MLADVNVHQRLRVGCSRSRLGVTLVAYAYRRTLNVTPMKKLTKRVLITGMSGSGKSAVTQELIARGFLAIDLDTAEWSEWVDTDSDALTPGRGKDWIWREGRVRTLLSEPKDVPLFVSGTAANMGQFYSLIDLVILLSAPVATIMERLEARPAGVYGHSVEDRRKVNTLISTIEPLLRKSADHEIDTRSPTHTTVDEILRLANVFGAGAAKMWQEAAP